MTGIGRILILLAGAAFILAVVGAAFVGEILGIQPEAFSRACNNLALIAIAMLLVHKERHSA